MKNKNIFQKASEYRVKVERNGREIVNIPGILCLPGLLTAPRLTIAGMVAAPLLGLNVHLENESGKPVDIEKEVKKAADTFVNTAKETAKTIKEEIDKAWESVSADDPETEDVHETEKAEEAAVQEDSPDPAGNPEEHETEEIPVIHVNPDDSHRA